MATRTQRSNAYVRGWRDAMDDKPCTAHAEDPEVRGEYQRGFDNAAAGKTDPLRDGRQGGY